VFVKLHTHAMQNRASFLGAGADAMFSAMERLWNRPPFRLHYVTCREAYNIVKAAESGHAGDPNEYRDFVLRVPANRFLTCSGDWRLKSWTPQHVHLEVLTREPVLVEFGEGDLRSISGCLGEVEVCYRSGEVVSLRVVSDGPVEVKPSRCAAVLKLFSESATAIA